MVESSSVLIKWCGLSRLPHMREKNFNVGLGGATKYEFDGIKTDL